MFPRQRRSRPPVCLQRAMFDLVRIRHPEREPIERRLPVRREMENIFMTIIQETRRIDRLEMPARNFARPVLVRQGDRLHPVDRVLQDEKFPQPQDQLVREHRIRRRRADIEKKRPVRLKQALDLRGPLLAPVEIGSALRLIGKFPVANPEIVGRRRHHEIDRARREAPPFPPRNPPAANRIRSRRKEHDPHQSTSTRKKFIIPSPRGRGDLPVAISVFSPQRRAACNSEVPHRAPRGSG